MIIIMNKRCGKMLMMKKMCTSGVFINKCDTRPCGVGLDVYVIWVFWGFVIKKHGILRIFFSVSAAERERGGGGEEKKK